MSADGTDLERRESRRFPVVVPIEVSWRGEDGIAIKEDAVARQVNANGGFLKMSNYPALGSRVTLANFLSAQTAEARVLAAPDSRQGVANGIVVELVVPNESFWGVDLQVNKAIAESSPLRCCESRADAYGILEWMIRRGQDISVVRQNRKFSGFGPCHARDVFKASPSAEEDFRIVAHEKFSGFLIRYCVRALPPLNGTTHQSAE